MIEESDMAQHKNIDKNIEIYQEWSSSCCKGSGILFLNTPSNVSIAMICNTGYCCNKSDTIYKVAKINQCELSSLVFVKVRGGGGAQKMISECSSSPVRVQENPFDSR